MRSKSERGAAAVEFAIVLPILLVIVFGIIEFGFLLYDKAMVTNASREGARAGIVFRTNPTTGQPDRVSTGEITNIVLNYCGANLVSFGSGSSIDVTTAPAEASTITPGQNLTVTVSYSYNFLVLPAFVTGLAGNLNLGAATTMRAE